MIVTCERCDTRFRLDESRLPAGGARVRCSRCKHAFFVRPAGATAADTVHQIASDAATQMRPDAPAPSWDLEEDPNGRTAQSARSARSSQGSAALAREFEEESDWRFEDEMPELGDTGASLDLPNGEAPALPNADPNESSFAELGDPESWDLLSSPALDAPVSQPAVPDHPVKPAPAPSEPVVAKALARTPREPEPEHTPQKAPAPQAAVLPVVELSPAMRAGAWTAVLALIAAIVWTTLVPAAPASSQFGVAALGPLELGSLRARRVENAVVGPIWVVSGELHNPTSEPHALGAAIAVTLIDDAGGSADTAVAVPALEAQRLREADPQRVRDGADGAAAQLASLVLAPAASVPVDAVFAAPARGIARFAVATQAVRAPAPQPVAAPAAAEPLPAPAPATP